MEDCRLPADAGLIDRCAGIDVGPTVKEQSDGCNIAVFRSHVQKRSASQQKRTPAGLAAIEIRETLIHDSRFGVHQLRQFIKPPAQHGQHSRYVVPGLAAGLQKKVDTGAQPFQGTRVTRNEIVESRARIWMAGDLESMVATVRICAMVEKPFKSGRVQ